MRLSFLITPAPELQDRLQPDFAEGDFTTVVVTPDLDYEGHFEGWKKAWRAKAIEQFTEDWISNWLDSESELGEVARSMNGSQDLSVEFDRWWTIDLKDDVLEIAPEWRPGQ